MLKLSVWGEGRLDAGEAAWLRKGLLEGRSVVRLGEFARSVRDDDVRSASKYHPACNKASNDVDKSAGRLR